MNRLPSYIPTKEDPEHTTDLYHAIKAMVPGETRKWMLSSLCRSGSSSRVTTTTGELNLANERLRASPSFTRAFNIGLKEAAKKGVSDFGGQAGYNAYVRSCVFNSVAQEVHEHLASTASPVFYDYKVITAERLVASDCYNNLKLLRLLYPDITEHCKKRVNTGVWPPLNMHAISKLTEQETGEDGKPITVRERGNMSYDAISAIGHMTFVVSTIKMLHTVRNQDFKWITDSDFSNYFTGFGEDSKVKPALNVSELLLVQDDGVTEWTEKSKLPDMLYSACIGLNEVLFDIEDGKARAEVVLRLTSLCYFAQIVTDLVRHNCRRWVSTDH